MTADGHPETGPVLVAMSGGVDSSVAAALLAHQGHEVVGVTMKLWGGAQDSGCCSVSDVDDARRVADQLGIDHHVFNFGDDFDRHVVDPYVAAHAAGRTPNPCIECNRHLKFDKLLRRADALGFSRVATGHHARIVETPAGRRIARGADAAKDQSYVLHMLTPGQLARVELPLGAMTKDDVRRLAAELGLRTADKPDSQDVCFITATGGGRQRFLGDRLPLTPGRVVDTDGVEAGTVDAVELVTIGQRKGLGVSGEAEPRYAVAVDIGTATVTIGRRSELFCDASPIDALAWTGVPEPGAVQVQTSAHGVTAAGRVTLDDDGVHRVEWVEPHRRVAPGQALVFYIDDVVVGSATAA
ncbi:MAG: tRNA 2-thiouridine(34) synthase MnmA [Acidimicrobiales bacterium]